jgi:hypothetical protein
MVSRALAAWRTHFVSSSIARSVGRNEATLTILAGETKLSDSDLRDFPDVDAALRAAVWIATALKNVGMRKHLKYLA